MSFFTLCADSPKWYPILFDTPHNAVRSVFIWLTIALVIGSIISYFILRKNPLWERLKKGLLIGWIGYAATIIVTLLVFSFMDDGIVSLLFYPILALIFAIAFSAILLTFRRQKSTFIISGVMVGAALIAVLVCIGVHFASGAAAEANWITNDDVKPMGLYLIAVFVIGLLVFSALFFGRGDKSGFTTKSIAHGAVCVALSFALSFLRIVKMPQGGSITIASLLPIMIYAYIFGVKKGMFVGMIYGIMQSFQDVYILHPAQFVLDYPAAFACIGLAGLFAVLKVFEKSPRLQFVCGALLAGVSRFLVHFLSGIFAFGAFAPEGTPVPLYSLTYNMVYVFPDLLICIIVGVILFSSKSFVTFLKQQRAPSVKNENKEKEE